MNKPKDWWIVDSEDGSTPRAFKSFSAAQQWQAYQFKMQCRSFPIIHARAVLAKANGEENE